VNPQDEATFTISRALLSLKHENKIRFPSMSLAERSKKDWTFVESFSLDFLKKKKEPIFMILQKEMMDFADMRF